MYVRVHLPLQQGLRLLLCTYPLPMNLVVRVHLPLKQGLRQLYRRSSPKFQDVRVHLPSTHQLINPLTRQLINSPTHQLTNSLTHQLINSPTLQLINSSTHQLINSPTRQLITSSTRHPRKLKSLLLFYKTAFVFAPF